MDGLDIEGTATGLDGEYNFYRLPGGDPGDFDLVDKAEGWDKGR